jgi:toxin ParE1/3/4
VAAKRVVLRAAAELDVESAFEHYLLTAGADVAEGFIDALALAYAHLARHPATGSPRYGLKLNVPGLRSWPVNRYPYLVFYLDMPQEIDVVRVLHGAMDIPEWLDS